MRQTAHRSKTAIAAVAVVLGGCHGTIGDPPGAEMGAVPASHVVAAEPLHRLNRLEYNNTVRDLLGTTLTPADSFPPDTSADGFDNDAEGLTLSPSLMDLYSTAARELTHATLDDTPRFQTHVDAREHAIATAQVGTPFDWGWSLPRQGDKALAFDAVDFPQDESVTISILAGGSASATVPTPVMALAIDGAIVQQWTISAPVTAPTVQTFQTVLAKGTHAMTVVFANGYDQPAENVYNSLVVGYLDVTSDAIVKPAGRALVYVCDPTEAADEADCYRTIVVHFAERAWRRPLTPSEAESLFELWQGLASSEGKDTAVSLVVRGVLLSSKFLYRSSVAASVPSGAIAGLESLDDYVIAGRLSYFLWSSMPDDALFDAAAAGALRTPDGLRLEVERMLADPKSAGLRKGFAAQWLGTRALVVASPDVTVFPDWDESLRAAMIEETELFFDDFLHNGYAIGDMMAPDFGFVNARLAKHYALPSGIVPGDKVYKVHLDSKSRRGLLTQGSWLTAHSVSDRSSPVKRGRFVLEQILCTPIPPPPKDVPPFEAGKPGATIRETLAEHRKNPACASCHNLLDPAGLGFEEFDGIGAQRETEQDKPVDTSGAIPPGLAFDGAAELEEILKNDRRFTECVEQKLLSYALGRRLVESDTGWLDAISEALPDEGDSLDALIGLIVTSPAFRMRSAEAAE